MHHFPPHVGELGAVKLNQQPGRGGRPASVAPKSALPRSVGLQLPVNWAYLVGVEIGLESSVKGQPAQEIVVRRLGHSGSGHVDVGLGDVGVVKGQAVKGEAIRPVRWRFGHHAKRGQPRLGEDGGVVHEAAKVVGQGDGAVGPVAGDVVDQRLEGEPKGVLENEVEFGVELPQHGEVQNAARGSINPAPRLAGRQHLRRLNKGCIIR